MNSQKCTVHQLWIWLWILRGKGREGLKERGRGASKLLITLLKWGGAYSRRGGLIKRELTRRFTVNATGWISSPGFTCDYYPVNKKATGSSNENGYLGWGGGGGNASIEVLRCRNSRSNTMFIYPLCTVYVGQVLFFVYFFLACLHFAIFGG